MANLIGTIIKFLLPPIKSNNNPILNFELNTYFSSLYVFQAFTCYNGANEFWSKFKVKSKHIVTTKHMGTTFLTIFTYFQRLKNEQLKIWKKNGYQQKGYLNVMTVTWMYQPRKYWELKVLKETMKRAKDHQKSECVAKSFREEGVNVHKVIIEVVKSIIEKKYASLAIRISRHSKSARSDDHHTRYETISSKIMKLHFYVLRGMRDCRENRFVDERSVIALKEVSKLIISWFIFTCTNVILRLVTILACQHSRRITWMVLTRGRGIW